MPYANRVKWEDPGIELTVIDDSDLVGFLAAATRVNELYMTDVKSMVDSTIRGLAQYRGKKLRRLNILDHGNSQELEIGRDVLSVSNISKHAPVLSRLTPLFHRRGFVHLQHCDIGQNKAVLSALSLVWRVPVYAGTGKHNPVYRFNLGRYERCVPSGDCESDVARP